MTSRMALLLIVLSAAAGCTLPRRPPRTILIPMVGSGPTFDRDATATERAIRRVPPFRGWGRRLWMPRVEAHLAARDPDGPGRLIDVDEVALSDVLAAAFPDTTCDAALVLVHGQTGGAGGAGLAIIGCADPAFPGSALHELGHALANLGDEYPAPGPLPPLAEGVEPPHPNLTAQSDPARVKWRDLYGHDGVGLFEGGGYRTRGLYRPASRCIMRRPSDGRYCAVCLRALEQHACAPP